MCIAMWRYKDPILLLRADADADDDEADDGNNDEDGHFARV